ncbi:biotin/lipoyl-binding protein [Balneolales bacterium ANBcel1]|nr:biotin/lipoyl-binding protein [Balneolales bacterium ANBcel1]
MAENFDKIPVPPSRKWREMRVRILPFLIFALVALVVAYLWKDRVDAANMVGYVVGQQAEIRSPQNGSLADISVRPFDTVSAGDQIGRLITTDPRIVEAELSVVLAEIELIRLSMDPIADQQRNLLNYESLQMDLMENRARLGIAEIRKQAAEREYRRLQDLHERGLASDEQLEQSQTGFLTLQEEVEKIGELVDRMENRLAGIDLEDLMAVWKEEDPRAAAIEVQRRTIDRIRAEMMPITLHAPVSGQISAVYGTSGEYVDRGDTIAIIRSPKPDYILAHLRHPLVTTPEPGMEVLVRKQDRQRSETVMRIAEVGVHMETIQHMSSLFPDQPFETTGLPVRVALNHELDLIPGEVVDMRLLVR